MFVETKLFPDIERVLNFAQCEFKKGQCEIRPFKPMSLESNWGDGTRYFYTLIDLVEMRTMPIPQNGNLGQPRSMELETLPTNYCVLETVIFCGKKMFPRIYLNPENIQKYISEPEIKLTPEEESFFQSYRGLKSSYRPINETLKNSLIQKGFLAKNGAVTIRGKNYRR